MDSVNNMLDEIGLERLVHKEVDEYIRRLINTGMSADAAMEIYHNFMFVGDVDGLERYLSCREWRYQDGLD